MAIKYYYIDDDPHPTIEEIARGLSIYPERLIVQAYQHNVWDKQIDFLLTDQRKYDGLLIDWNLSNNNSDGLKANFDVEALAQQIRRYATEKDSLKSDFPIVLCSAKFKLKDIFSRELTSHNLFDEVYEKDDFDTHQEQVINQLEELANGYKTISKTKSPKRILGLKSDNECDYRIIDRLKILIDKNEPNHEIARFILKKVVKPPGVLLDKYMLASKLGVDIIDNLSKDWNRLNEILDDTRYKGIFAKGWDRWWSSKVYDWWERIFDLPLGSLDGTERVNLINKKFKLRLNPAHKTLKSQSTNFWVICKKSNKPIAIEDSLIASFIEDKPEWIEDEYYSIDEALEIDSLKIHPLERDRLKNLKKKFERVRKK